MLRASQVRHPVNQSSTWSLLPSIVDRPSGHWRCLKRVHACPHVTYVTMPIALRLVTQLSNVADSANAGPLGRRVTALSPLPTADNMLGRVYVMARRAANSRLTYTRRSCSAGNLAAPNPVDRSRKRHVSGIVLFP
jgi:hypothetical protein